MPPATLVERLQTAVDRRFDGSVNAAAKAWRVPQPTLKRILDGGTQNPRADVLVRIAKGLETTVEYLLTGDGGPDPFAMMGEPPEQAQWVELVRSLRLKPDVERMIGLAPWTIDGAHHLLVLTNYDGSALSLHTTSSKVEAAHWRASVLLLRAWIGYFKALIAEYGAKGVAAKLEAEREWARVGFHPFTGYLIETDRLSSEADVAWHEFVGDHPGRVAIKPQSFAFEHGVHQGAGLRRARSVPALGREIWRDPFAGDRPAAHEQSAARVSKPKLHKPTPSPASKKNRRPK